MPFKIVQTNENNKTRLFTVPSEWEDQNILKWPRKNMNKLMKYEFSLPENDWYQDSCIVKRREIPSYETAEYILSEMLKHSDTEDETNVPKKKPLQELNLNIIADEIICPPNEEVTVSKSKEHFVETCPTTAPPPFSNVENEVYQFHIVSNNQNENIQHQCSCANLEQTLAMQNILLTNQTNILEKLNTIEKVQNTMLQKFSFFSVQLEDAVFQINANSNLHVTELTGVRNTPSNTAFGFKPIDNIQRLNEFENQLTDKSAREKLKNTFSVICSGGKGIDCAYTLTDILFSREFLCQFTWSGGSRGDDVKIAWKSYKNTLCFFWDMIRCWDTTYTIKDNEAFFKTVLKNSKKRKMAKNQRASTSRKRTKLSKLETGNDEKISEEDGNTSDKTDEENEDNKSDNIIPEKNSQNMIVVENSVDEENTMDDTEEEDSTDSENADQNILKSNKTNIEKDDKVQKMPKELYNFEEVVIGAKEEGEENKEIGNRNKDMEKEQHDVNKAKENITLEKKNTDEQVNDRGEIKKPNKSFNRIRKKINMRKNNAKLMKRLIKQNIKLANTEKR